MTVISFLLFIVIFAVIAYLCYWVITKFFPEPAKMPALAVIGVMLLLVLLSQMFPEIGTYRLFK